MGRWRNGIRARLKSVCPKDVWVRVPPGPLSISGCGSVGRAPRLGRGGPQFESGHPDKLTRAHSSMVEQFPLKEKVEGSNPSGLTNFP